MREGIAEAGHKLDFGLLEEELKEKEAKAQALAADREARKKAAIESAEQVKQAKLLIGGTVANFLGVDMDISSLLKGEQETEEHLQEEAGKQSGRLPAIVSEDNEGRGSAARTAAQGRGPACPAEETPVKGAKELRGRLPGQIQVLRQRKVTLSHQILQEKLWKVQVRKEP